jgi:hypothetical protein
MRRQNRETLHNRVFELATSLSLGGCRTDFRFVFQGSLARKPNRYSLNDRDFEAPWSLAEPE